MISRRYFLRLLPALAFVLFVGSAPLAALAQAAVQEKEILLEFKGNVTSDPGGALASWVTGGDPCRDFAGVFCDGGSVAKVLIHGADLAGILPASLAGLRSLQIISLFGNRFSGSVPPEYAAILNLRKFNVSRNLLSGGVPGFLGGLPGLRLLDLSYNAFSGEIPAALFGNCIKTRFISLSHNALTGPIPADISNCSRLIGIDLSFNNLTGEFIPQICEPPDINYFSVRNNSLSGTVVDKITECQRLDLFDIGSNAFSGEAPFNLLSLQNLSYFDASSNKFQGEMPDISVCSDKLGFFDISGNELSGGIPRSIAICRGLRLLDLRFNNLTGSIPPELASLKSLSVLRLGNNAGIGGLIPAELGGIELLEILDIQNLQLSSEIPVTLSQCQFLLELDVSGNHLVGGIPDTLYNITYLKRLDLHSNQLNGSIPSSLGQLKNLEYLDFSENSLTGTIPLSLGGITSLKYFNVSYNNLSGAIPSSSTIQQFGPLSFLGNPLLCGPPIDAVCSSSNFSRRTRVLTAPAIIAIIAASIIIFGVLVVIIMNIQAYRKRLVEEEIFIPESTPPISTDSTVISGKLVLFSNNLPSRYEDWESGTKALLNKDFMVGDGSLGTVYKAIFEDGISIAVKKLETLGRIRNQEQFEQEIGQLGSLKHPNLVAFHGYYWSSTMQLMLSEFISNGCLYDHLHGPRRVDNLGSSSKSIKSELFWSRRFNIALGTAKALTFLHNDCRPQVLHLNIKSTNILLDEEYEAKLSDYGLGKLLPILDSYASSKFHMAVGYVAPELASQSLRYSDKCDVYSFGVILLEIVTGRKPVESSGGAKTVVILRDYVRSLLDEGTVSECFDKKLSGFNETELIQVLKLGLICTSEASSKRPCMAEVVQFLESLQPNSSSA